MNKDLSKIIEQFVDFLMPELTPYEAAMYIFLLRSSHLKNSPEIHIGKRTIAEKWGTGARGKKTNYAHVTDLVKGLEKKGCIKIGDVNREGTLYKVLLPEEIPLVLEKLLIIPETGEEGYFTDPERRKELFERDKWICCYCGEKVTEKNATLDHFNPQSNGGKHTKDNLKTCCFICNAIKSGKTYEEAAPFLLKSIRERKQKS
ncbi:MAG: hypothetical protein A3K83_00235 [Omnitrophica WOR_2 bacterium RBG_13_44_8b]|nr:MAG: hypothetical protein A3K83_00235 [Omnitrophica WOR_2 bacterium RBG_13_44_8b]